MTIKDWLKHETWFENAEGLKKARKRIGVTQAELSRAAQVTPSAGT